jgi:glycerophosphoryl diester phosphodiesterase
LKLNRFFSRPIAHRGLHDALNGIIENSISAAKAAIAHNYSIECDVQLTKDGEAVVFHDFTLERLTNAKGAVIDHSAQDLCVLSLEQSADKISTLEQFIKIIAGKTPLIIEIKSPFNGDLRLTHRVAQIVKNHPTHIAVKSFDPACIAELRRITPTIPRGIIGMSHYEHNEFAHISEDHKNDLINLHHLRDTMPDFISWHVHHLENLAAILKKNELTLPIMAWTVRTNTDRLIAQKHADQIIFESFMP